MVCLQCGIEHLSHWSVWGDRVWSSSIKEENVTQHITVMCDDVSCVDIDDRFVNPCVT